MQKCQLPEFVRSALNQVTASPVVLAPSTVLILLGSMGVCYQPLQQWPPIRSQQYGHASPRQ